MNTILAKRVNKNPATKLVTLLYITSTKQYELHINHNFFIYLSTEEAEEWYNKTKTIKLVKHHVFQPDYMI